MCYTVYVLGANLGWFRGETNFQYKEFWLSKQKQ